MVGKLARPAHATVEGDDAAQVILLDGLGDGDVARQRAGVGDGLAVHSDERAFLGILAIERVVHADNLHAVIGEQLQPDGVGELEFMEDRAEDGMVIHRVQFQPERIRPSLGSLRRNARRGGHEQAFAGADFPGIEHGGEGAFLDARAAVGLIRDDQVERLELVLLEGERHGGGRLVGGEDHAPPAPAQERGNRGGLGGRRHAQLADVGDEMVLAADGLVGADRQVAEWLEAVLGPVAQELGNQ